MKAKLIVADKLTKVAVVTRQEMTFPGGSYNVIVWYIIIMTSYT